MDVNLRERTSPMLFFRLVFAKTQANTHLRAKAEYSRISCSEAAGQDGVGAGGVQRISLVSIMITNTTLIVSCNIRMVVTQMVIMSSRTPEVRTWKYPNIFTFTDSIGSPFTCDWPIETGKYDQKAYRLKKFFNQYDYSYFDEFEIGTALVFKTNSFQAKINKDLIMT